jgi:regulation of enolase protein 1 (concanavalin A-like superfamily)
MKTFLTMICFVSLLAVAGANAPVLEKRASGIVTKHWGEVLDPDGDCRFVLEKGRLVIGVPGTDHSLGFERGQMNAPRALRAIEGDFIAQVKVSCEFPEGATSLVPTRRPFHGAGFLLWLDEKNYIRLERAEMVYEGNNLSYASFESRLNGEFVRRGSASEMPLPPGATYLRLERRGGMVYASTSADGNHWLSMEPIEIELPKMVSLGVAAGHNTSSPFEAEFDDFRVFVEQ